MKRSIGTITEYLGDGAYRIKLHTGSVMDAQIFNAPGVADRHGTVYTKEALDGIAPSLIGRAVTAEPEDA